LKRAYLTRELPSAAMDIVAADCELTYNPLDRPLTREELMIAGREADGLLTMLTETVDRELLDACPRLRVVANCAVGYNNIDIAACTERGILVTNTPGVLTETTADLTFALLLASARRIVEADGYLRAGEWQSWSLMLLTGTDVHGKTLGIVGFGRIGQAVARRARGFGMRIIYTGGSGAADVAAELGAKRVKLPELLRSADFVSLHVPYGPSTHHLIGEAELAMMKPGAHLINTARGAVVDEQALIAALTSRRIAGAGLDVFTDEPDVPALLAELDNVVLTPHIGSATVETRTRMAVMAASNLVAVLKGEPPLNPVNPEARRGDA
jgi:glyoxylate reductase